jgi:hypothetical protein
MNYFYLIKVSFPNKDIRNTELNFKMVKIGEENNITYYNNELCAFCMPYSSYGNEISDSVIFSCYETASFYIVCFFQLFNNSNVMIVYTEELEYKKELIIYNSNSTEKFFKCIHFYNDTGIFSYYNNDDLPSLILEFKDYDPSTESIKSHYKDNYSIKLKYPFDSFIKSNDLIAVNNNKFYFVSISIYKQLYIISINNYNEEKFAIRIYKIELINLYNFILYLNIKLAIYNNFLALATTHSSSNHVYPSLIIFSYLNSTDTYMNIEEYLIKNNNITINAISMDVKCVLENNIFGYIFKGIHLSILSYKENNNNNIYLSTLNNTKITTKDIFLDVNETKNLNLNIDESDNYNSFNFTIEYYCIATEPDYESYNK